MIECEVHSFNIDQRELVVSIYDDEQVVVDNRNIGLPLSGRKPDLDAIRKLVSSKVEDVRLANRDRRGRSR